MRSLLRALGIAMLRSITKTASARRVVGNVRVPMLMITAQDDPFVPYESFLAALVADNPAIRFVAPEHGGHCSFISKHPGRERFWRRLGWSIFATVYACSAAVASSERLFERRREARRQQLRRALGGDHHVVFAADADSPGM